ncbi:hypothetical protein F5878DRAFT_14400 [Lentinula raphanica]|uniref:DUF6534 domain-containing protein n=1 Tax=Lentinula raphanica TaxID=153919 RepID=A0AA38PEY8_9AGAR|nr:hypothetical protein F5878DRAFT_14400 [Lentinula raphanica]
MSNLTSAATNALLQSRTIDNTLGAVFIGIIGATFLFGITTLQVYLYYHHYQGDSRLHKLAVAVLWILDTVHLVLIVHAVYHYTIKGFGDLNNLNFIVWSVKVQVTINVVIILFVQSLYAYRVWILGGYHHGVLGYIAGVVAGGFGIGAALAYKIYTIQMFEELHTISWSIDLSLATSTAIDFTISSTMCYYLHKSRCSESWQLNSRISTVMQYSLSSGLFTSACSLSTLFTYTLMPDNLIYLSLQFLSTKFYVASFLAMLNARQHRAGNSGSSTSDSPKPAIEFRVQTTTFTDDDLPWHETSPTSPAPAHSAATDSQITTYIHGMQMWNLYIHRTLCIVCIVCGQDDMTICPSGRNTS